MKALISAASLITVILVSPVPAAAAADRHSLVDKTVQIRYDGLLRSAAEEVLNVYPTVRRELRTALGWESDIRPEIVLLKDSIAFKKEVGSSLITAYAVAGSNLIVVDYSRMVKHPSSMKETLKHELCHLELHRHIRGDLPRWLNEGVCQWVSGGLSELISGRNRAELDMAVLSGRIIRLELLQDKFPEEGKELLLAYEQSISIVEYIVREYGPGELRGILESMAGGMKIEEAVLYHLKIPFDELEKGWRASLGRKTSWLYFVRDNLYEILFLIAAMLTISGFIKVLRKKQQYRDDGDDEAGGENKVV